MERLNKMAIQEIQREINSLKQQRRKYIHNIVTFGLTNYNVNYYKDEIKLINANIEYYKDKLNKTKEMIDNLNDIKNTLKKNNKILNSRMYTHNL